MKGSALNRTLRWRICLIAATAAMVFAPLPAFAQDLPPIRLNYASVLLSADGKLLHLYGKERRVEIEGLGQVSKHVIDALIATEDRGFYSHNGVSTKGLGRAILNTLTGSTQGGSTITMQLARNLFLTQERTISRKVTEIQLAQALEAKYSKKEILRLYLNTVYFGHGCYGIWTASMEYFQKPPGKLTVSEAAMIVGLLQSPNGYDPVKKPQKALNRRNEVLHNLVETGKLSNAEFKKLRGKPLGLNLFRDVAPHFAEFVRRTTTDTLKAMGKSLFKDQLTVTSTLDYAAQLAADEAVRQQYAVLPKSMKAVQVGLVAVEPGTGSIRAMIGGNEDAEPSGWNWSTQNRRQAGSAFKPFLYATVLAQGYTLATPLMNAPVVVDSGKAWEWRPMNDDGTYTGGPVPMKLAIQESLNLCAADAVTHYSSPERIITLARQLGFWSDLPSVPSIALGTGSVTPREMATGMAAFAAYGWYAPSHGVLKIEDHRNRTIYRYSPQPVEVLDSAVCYLLTDALQTVVNNGTASVIRKFYKGPAAGKTGTTQNSTDAWFAGYTPSLATVVWFGHANQKQKLEGQYSYGGSLAAPLWGRMMGELVKKKPALLGSEFARPTNVIDVAMCLKNGLPYQEFCSEQEVFPMMTLKLPMPLPFFNFSPFETP